LVGVEAGLAQEPFAGPAVVVDADTTRVGDRGEGGREGGKRGRKRGGWRQASVQEVEETVLKGETAQEKKGREEAREKETGISARGREVWFVRVSDPCFPCSCGASALLGSSLGFRV
jgi:hypothetical protein